MLADIAGTGFCRPVCVTGEASRIQRILIEARRHPVRQYRATQNTVRGFPAALGIRFRRGSGTLAGLVRAVLAERDDLKAMIEPLLASADSLALQIKRLDAEVSARAKVSSVCRLLMTVPGVGPITALAFAATIDDAGRFAKSRTVGAYRGLTSRRFQSGEVDYTGKISKFGDGRPRSLLYEAANSLLTVVRRAHPLKDWARRIRKRSSHKKACVALARKLVVIMHRMTVTGPGLRPDLQPAVLAA